MKDRKRHGRSPKGAIAAILAMVTVGLVAAAALAKQRSREDHEQGNGGDSLDGATPPQDAMGDFKMPEDMRAVIPEPPSYAPA